MGTVVLDEAPIDRSRLISRCGFREIDDPARHKGAPVVDAHHHRAACTLVGDLNTRAEGQAPVSLCKGMGVEPLAVV